MCTTSVPIPTALLSTAFTYGELLCYSLASANPGHYYSADLTLHSVKTLNRLQPKRFSQKMTLNTFETNT